MVMASRASSVSPTESRECSGCECASPSRGYSSLQTLSPSPTPTPTPTQRHDRDRDVDMRDDDLQYDHHSSEEELEVINSSSQEIFSKYGCVESEQELDCEADGDRCSPALASALSLAAGRSATRIATAGSGGGRASRRSRNGPPEKRKWAQAGDENDENARGAGGAGGDVVSLAAADAVADATARAAVCGAPVLRFRTSPPLEALKPRGPPLSTATATPLAAVTPPPPLAPHNSPPAKVFHLSADATSPRKRTRHIPRRHIQRPCLDFDKMQQLKVRPVTAWRHGAGEHGGELSVFCW